MKQISKILSLFLAILLSFVWFMPQENKVKAAESIKIKAVDATTGQPVAGLEYMAMNMYDMNMYDIS